MLSNRLPIIAQRGVEHLRVKRRSGGKDGEKEEAALMEHNLRREIFRRQAIMEETLEARIKEAAERLHQADVLRRAQDEQQYRVRWEALRVDQAQVVDRKIAEISDACRRNAKLYEDQVERGPIASISRRSASLPTRTTTQCSCARGTCYGSCS